VIGDVIPSAMFLVVAEIPTNVCARLVNFEKENPGGFLSSKLAERVSLLMALYSKEEERRKKKE
jgi:hypothetical protein